MAEFEGWLFSSELCGWDEEVACGEGNVYSTGIENEFGNSNGGKNGLGVVFFATSLQFPFRVLPICWDLGEFVENIIRVLVRMKAKKIYLFKKIGKGSFKP